MTPKQAPTERSIARAAYTAAELATLAAAVTSMLLSKGGVQDGNHVLVPCQVFPPRHVDQSRPGTLLWSEASQTYHCAKCDARGGVVHFARLLGVPMPSASERAKRIMAERLAKA